MEPLPAPLTPMGARTPLAHPGLYAVITGLSVVIIIGALWVFWPRNSTTPEPNERTQLYRSPTQEPRAPSELD